MGNKIQAFFFVSWTTFSINSWKMGGAFDKPNGMTKGLKIRPDGVMNAHKFWASGDNETCQKPDLMSSLLLYLNLDRFSTASSMLGNDPAWSSTRLFNFR